MMLDCLLSKSNNRLYATNLKANQVSFNKLGLSESIVKAVHEKGYKTPTPIQLQSIPAILKKADLLACAQTGTGKTAGFTLPILELLSSENALDTKNPRALILTPTRELAAQIQESIQTYSKYQSIRSTMVFGGVNINQQILKLQNGIDILVATPGRLLDLYKQGALNLKNVQILVLDEADRMLDMGFIHDIKKVLAIIPKQRQSLLFSATFSNEIRTLAKGFLNEPIEISVTPKIVTAKRVSHKIHPVDKAQKSALLCHLIDHHNWRQTLVFTRTKHGANKLTKKLCQNNLEAIAIHGNKSQSHRTKALENFKKGAVRVLVATDIAARGIDIEQLGQVVNFDLPNVPEDYVHRIGRTGRAGAAGQAVSLVSADEIKQLMDIEKLLKHSLKREIVDGFDPIHNLPTSLKSVSNNPNHPQKKKTASKARNQKRNSSKSKAGSGNFFTAKSKSTTTKSNPRKRSRNRTQKTTNAN